MFQKLKSAATSLVSTTAPSSHHAAARTQTYADLAQDLQTNGVPVDLSDCYSCENPCPPGTEQNRKAGTVVETGTLAWEGKSYEEYALEKYGEFEGLPEGFDTDWDSELAGSGGVPRGRVVVISTGKSDWVRDHTDEPGSFAQNLEKHLRTIPQPPFKKDKKDFSARPPVSDYVGSLPDLAAQDLPIPSTFSSSLISQSDDPEDQSVLVFPDWKVVHEVENTKEGGKEFYEGVLRGGAGVVTETRRRSWALPYRAVVLLSVLNLYSNMICFSFYVKPCDILLTGSHKRRDKRCHIAAPLLRSALRTCLAAHDISIDETGSSLTDLSEQGLALETLSTDVAAELERRKRAIESVEGGDGGEVGIFNINHLGGHRYAGVMIILFPSGAYLSYGRVTPQEIPRVVEETILKGKVVPGLLRSAVGLSRSGEQDKGFLNW